LISGEALELWMIKVACGLYYAIGSKDEEKLSKAHSINMTKIERVGFSRWALFSRITWRENRPRSEYRDGASYR
jgi:hypothetical protein